MCVCMHVCVVCVCVYVCVRVCMCVCMYVYKVVHPITTFRPTTDHIHDGGPTILQHNITILTTVLQLPYSIQYSNTLYKFVA